MRVVTWSRDKLLSGAFLVCAFGTGVSFPLFKAPTNIFFYTLIVLALFDKAIRSQLSATLQNRTVQVGFLLVGLFLIGLAYSPVSFEYSFRVFLKYLRFELPIVLIPFFSRERHVRAFFYGLAASIFLMLFTLFGNWHPQVINPIYASFIWATFFSICLVLFLNGNNWVLIPMAAIGYTLLFQIQQRTGLIILEANVVCITAIYAFFRREWRRPVIVCVLFLGVPFVMQKKVPAADIIKREVADIIQKKPQLNSWGYRLEFIKNGVKLWKEAPVFGHGTGSYATLSRNHNYPYIRDTDEPNPHNEYIHIIVELGLVGLLTFLLWQATLFVGFGQRTFESKLMLCAFMISLMMGLFSDSMFFLNSTRDFIFAMVAVFQTPFLSGKTVK
ncbi:MAG: hypothetical protein A2Y14_01370 [Verrucomicrobia bacterium GWF2_51_19]|nr:MAG: hypothetical protein A2Y14_01370 [Verrucomicrobia bacterium GWF2_51_19]HCJ11723.1 hypothetical protein [Opitutae bacterium]